MRPVGKGTGYKKKHFRKRDPGRGNSAGTKKIVGGARDVPTGKGAKHQGTRGKRPASHRGCGVMTSLKTTYERTKLGEKNETQAGSCGRTYLQQSGSAKRKLRE